MFKDSVECEACLFWERVGGGHGQCRRHAPQVRIVTPGDIRGAGKDGWPTYHAAWPLTLADEWCGEGKRGQP